MINTDRRITGDCREVLRQLIAEGVKVQMCVTSPPYWGLRDYGVDGQIGLESTPEEYLATMVDVFRLVREVLADDGTLWLNLGDSYAAGKMGRDDSGGNGRFGGPRLEPKERKAPPGLKPKDLCGMPWRVAFALQADGWYLRSDIIWHKPNPMPESCTDRPTKAHEYVFLLSKQAKYYYDAEAVKEPCNWPEGSWAKSYAAVPKEVRSFYGEGRRWEGAERRNRRTVWTIPSHPFKDAHFATFPPKLVEPCIMAGSRPGDIVLDPFLGSGTVAEVAERLGRGWIGIDLNPGYEQMQATRTAQQGMALHA